MQTFHLIQYLFVTTCTYSSLSNNLLVNSLSTCNYYLILSLTVVLCVCVGGVYIHCALCGFVVFLCVCVCVYVFV